MSTKAAGTVRVVAGQRRDAAAAPVAPADGTPAPADGGATDTAPAAWQNEVITLLRQVAADAKTCVSNLADVLKAVAADTAEDTAEDTTPAPAAAPAADAPAKALMARIEKMDASFAQLAQAVAAIATKVFN